MTKMNLKKALMLLALGSTTLAVTFMPGSTGCTNAFWADFTKGLGLGAISAGTDALLDPLPDDTQAVIQTPINTALGTAWSNWVSVQWPVVIVREELFKN